MRWIVTLVLAAGVLVAPTGASAHHRPTTYCSPTGDICQSTANVHGERRLRISLAARYFWRYRLCVTAPDDSETCRVFRIRKHGPVYSSTIRWAAQFPPSGHGKYEVRWKSLPGGALVGKILGFHVV